MIDRFYGQLAAIAAVALAVPAVAFAGDFVLHPNGFGHTRIRPGRPTKA